ncbi:protein YpfM [Enterobacter kobei]
MTGNWKDFIEGMLRK